MPAWSTQLAEVALPISYKLKNIEATERIASQAGESVASGSSNIAAMYRFNTQERAPKVHPSMAGFDASDNNAAQKRPLKSSDDYALEQYKKVCLVSGFVSLLRLLISPFIHLTIKTETNEPATIKLDLVTSSKRQQV